MLYLRGPGSADIYGLPLHTPQLQARLDGLYDAGRLPELIDPHTVLASLRPDWPTPPATPWPRPRLGMIYWPVVGRARYAFGCLLIDEYTRGVIRAQMETEDSNAVTVILREDPDDEEEVGVELPMYALAFRPLVRTTDAAFTEEDDDEPVDAWVMLVVDARWARLAHSASSFTAGTWAGVFGNDAITITDAVNADYLTPSTRWTSGRCSGRPLSWLMDIAALSVGSRIVTTNDGTATLQRPDGVNSGDLGDAYTDIATEERNEGGGPVEDTDVDQGMPENTRVVFAGLNESTPSITDVTVQADFEWPTTSYLTHWADAPTTIGSAARSALASQWTDDWRAWQDGTYDVTISGFVDVPSNGKLWAVEYFQSSRQGYTKFIRPPHWYGYLLAPSRSPGTGDDAEEGGCEGCGWLADLRDDDCLKVSVVSAAGACACAATEDEIYISSTDGQTWGEGAGGDSGGGSGATDGMDLSACCPTRAESFTTAAVAFTMQTGDCAFTDSGMYPLGGNDLYPGLYYSGTVHDGPGVEDWFVWLKCEADSGGFSAELVQSTTGVRYDGVFVSLNCGTTGDVVVVFDFTLADADLCTGSVRATFTLSP